MQIQHHKLTDAPFKESPNQGGPITVDTIIIHYTGGASAESSIETLTNSEAKVSAHVMVSAEGDITQMVPFNAKAWHAGKSHYGDRTGMNQYSIGIELDNPGVLKKSGQNYVSWFGRKYPEEEVIEAVHRNEDFTRFWHIFPEEQINAAYSLCELLIKNYDIKYLLGHEEVSPGRKTDPGPAFPLDKFRDKLLLEDRSSDEPDTLPGEAEVAVPRLNFRNAPGTHGQKITQPLKKGTLLKIIRKEGDWYQVEAPVKGWVMSKYVKTDDS
ncbi:MAG: N-acetylmuramoyl-L-alanine amidase [Bacteroidales bacterium]|nr:N-acetylmuramoyl-L-alanine amidase [Bacteroidales bacterium]MCF8333398.1 N-acetylmuramoyl-L-alanine amidase [Bacteroidales bacterium]